MTEPFKFSDGQLAYTAEELFSLCQKSPTESLEYLMREDFEKWLNYIGKSDLAAKAGQIRQASLSDSDRIKQFISQCQSAPIATTKVPTPAPKVAVAATQTKPTATKPKVTSTAPKKSNPLGVFFKNLFSKN